MAKKVALLSGKGGSGKTSLALTIGSLFAESKISALVIDCDLATNGATYFYEENLISNLEGKYCVSLKDVFTNPRGETIIKPIKEKNKYAFLPSVSTIAESGIDVQFDFNSADAIKKLNSECDKYEVVIFDFQAGYSKVLDQLIDQMDFCFFVLEPDAVSASAVLSLYIKVKAKMKNVKTYQIFNKASEEEFKTYSKITAGTMTPMLCTIKFDWKIKKAFSLSQTPEIMECGEEYIKQIYAIAEMICPTGESEKKLKSFMNFIRRHELVEKKRAVELKIDQLTDEYEAPRSNTNFQSIIGLFISLMGIISLLASYYVNRELKEIPMLVSLVIIFTGFIYYAIMLSRKMVQRRNSEDKSVLRAYQTRLDEIDTELKEIQVRTPQTEKISTKKKIN